VYDTWLAKQPFGIVAHYPLPTDQPAAIHLGEREVFYQMYSHQPLYNIFGAGIGETREDAIRIMSRYVTDPQTPGILAAEHVRYVVLHDDVYREEDADPPKLSPVDFTLVQRFPNVRIFRVNSSVPPANLTSLLEENAASIALVQGLTPPTLEFGAGFLAETGGSYSLSNSGVIEMRNGDVNTARAQILIHAHATGGDRTIQLLDAAGRVLGSGSVGSGDTQVVLGPFTVPQGAQRLTLRTQPSGGNVVITSIQSQPLADFSVSLAAE
jgi:hypothetical protein